MPALPFEVLWTVSLLTCLAAVVLYWFGRRSRWTAAPTAARGHLLAMSVLTILATGVWGGPQLIASLWIADGQHGWSMAGGVPTSGTWSQTTLEPATATTGLLAGAMLLPSLWLAVIPLLGQVTWPHATSPRRAASMVERRVGQVVPLAPLVALGAATAAAAAGTALTAATPAIQGAAYRLRTAPESTPFVAGFTGVPAGSTVAGWYLAGILTVLVALCIGGAAVHRRAALSGLTPAADLAARRIAVGRAMRTGAALLCWIGIAGLAGRLEAHARHSAVAEAAAAFTAQQERGLSTSELVRHLSGIEAGSAAPVVFLAGSAVTAAVLVVLLRPSRDLCILEAGATGSTARPGPQRGTDARD